jgi:hypothetical protein
MQTVQLQWLVARAARSTDDDFKKGTFATDLVKAADAAIDVVKADHGWYGRQLMKDASSLRSKAEKLQPGEQSSLLLPN